MVAKWTVTSLPTKTPQALYLATPLRISPGLSAPALSGPHIPWDSGTVPAVHVNSTLSPAVMSAFITYLLSSSGFRPGLLHLGQELCSLGYSLLTDNEPAWTSWMLEGY